MDKSFKLSVLLIIVFMLILATACSAKVVYVKTTGSNASDGLAWATAKKTITAGLNIAASGDQVWAAKGTYVENIVLIADVALYGGFLGTETSLDERNSKTNKTVIDGNKSGSAVTCPSGLVSSARIDGFTITNGSGTRVYDAGFWAYYGGGVYCYSSSPTITNNTITGNGSSSISGGGISCLYSSPTIANNTITGNTGYNGSGIECYSYSSPTIANNTITENIASNVGGGIGCLFDSSPTISDNTIIGNSASSGGGIGCWQSAPTIRNNTITGNSASTGGGIGNGGFASPTMRNNTISGNSAVQGGGICCTDSSTTIINNTIIGNSANQGGGIYCLSPSGQFFSTIVNTIVAYNSSGICGYRRSGDYATFKSCCVYGNTDYNFSEITDPTGADGNIAVDPVLASVEYGNVHIQPTSPCKDTGDDTIVQTGWVDIDSQPRIQGTHVDIGADESDGSIHPAGPYVIVRVSPDGNDANDGSSWANAKRTVQAAVSVAGMCGGDVWVKQGVYAENITLRSYAYMYGGFVGNETDRSQRNWKTAVSVLDGGAKGSVITAVTGYRNSRIDGFTVRNGNAQYGGGIYCSYSSPTIANNTITGNNTSSSGGGIYCSYSSSTITDNTITGNNTSSNGGGIYCASSVTITNNTITGNSASSSGGGIYCASSAAITNNTITGNSACSSGGGIYCASSAAITNNTLIGNSAYNGGGICCDNSSPTITNTIIAFNSSGVYRNNSGTPTVRSCCVYGNAAYNFSGITDPTGANGNIAADPVLASVEYGNVHIQPTSPCKDTGDDTIVQTGWVDIDSQPRIQGTHVDIGADESDGTVHPAGPYVIVRVSPDGNDASDGSSWANAKRTVQAAVSVAGMCGGDVWVKQGVYAENITLRSYAYMYGGFVGNETDRSQRNWKTAVSVLDGGAKGSVITAVTGYRNSRIDGFTVRNGNAQYGGGIYCSSASPTIANNTITGNNTSSDGGGIYCSYSSPAITGNTITGNTSYSDGGGICCSYSSPTITDNAMTENTAYSSGGGIYCGSFATIANNTITGNIASSSGGGICCGSSVAITNNTIIGNIACENGGGIYCGSSPAIANNTIASNIAYSNGGGICCMSSSPTIINNTITGNIAYSYGGGIYSLYSSPTITNTIAAFNSSGIWGYSEGTSHPVFKSCCVYGNTAYDFSGLTNPTGANGNISVDPLFVNKDAGDYHLTVGSQCINAGDDYAVQADWKDIDGDDRIIGAHVDIGSDEWKVTVQTVNISGGKLLSDGTPVQINAVIISASFTNFFYIESDNRNSGIRVKKNGHGLTKGVRADVVGTVKTNSDGERYIEASAATQAGTGSVAPLAMNSKTLGGADWNCNSNTGAGQKGVTGGVGVNNIGLLVGVWGKVTEIASGCLYLDDGSNWIQGNRGGDSNHIGVIVVCDPSSYTVGAFLSVTGINSCLTTVGGHIVPQILTQGTGDIRRY